MKEKFFSIGLAKPLRRRQFAFLWSAMTISLLGDGLYLVAIAWLVYDQIGGPEAFAAVGAAYTIPMVLLLLPAGVLADRVSRRSLMIISDILRAIPIGAVGLIVLRGEIDLPVLVALIFVYGAGEALFWPAFMAVVPDIVPADELVQANALDNLMRPLALQLAGPAIGGVLVAVAGAGVAFMLDAASFAVSALCLAMMGHARRAASRPAEGSALREALAGLRYVRGQRWLAGGLAWSAVFLLLIWGPFDVLLPFVVKNDLGGGAADIGLVFAAGGVGAILVALVISQRGVPRRMITWMYVSWGLALAGISLFGIVQTAWQAMAVAFVCDGLFAFGGILWTTMRQRLVPAAVMGRVSSVDAFVSTAFAPVSFGLAAPVAAAIGARETLVLVGMLSAGITLLMFAVPGIRDPESDGRLGAPEPAVAPERASA